MRRKIDKSAFYHGRSVIVWCALPPRKTNIKDEHVICQKMCQGVSMRIRLTLQRTKELY